MSFVSLNFPERTLSNVKNLIKSLVYDLEFYMCQGLYVNPMAKKRGEFAEFLFQQKPISLGYYLISNVPDTTLSR